MSHPVRWGIIGCGNVTEVKSGPGFQHATGSALVAVMRRDRAKAEDYARRHGVPSVHTTAQALIDDPNIDAVYVATPPSTHADLAVAVATAGKPCLVEKPMATTHAECERMLEAFDRAHAPLWVAYYRRALPRFLLVRDLVRSGQIGRPTSVDIRVTAPLAVGDDASGWRFNPAVAGAGLFLDLGSHCLDLVDFLFGPITVTSGHAIRTGAGVYGAEDVTAAAFQVGPRMLGTGLWNFNADRASDSMTIAGTAGELRTPIFGDDDVTVRQDGRVMTHAVRNPPHVHQPLIQSIIDELNGRGHCASPGRSAARTSLVMDQCLAHYRQRARE